MVEQLLEEQQSLKEKIKEQEKVLEGHLETRQS